MFNRHELIVNSSSRIASSTSWVQLAAPQLRQLDVAVREYEAAWREGRGEPIEEFVQRFPQIDTAILLKELLIVDFQRLWRAGEIPNVADYVARFPEHAEWIAAVQGEHDSADVWGCFDEEGAARSTDELSIRPEGLDSTGQFSLPDRYQLGAMIARGGMGTVYSAYDRQLQREIAIKVMGGGAGRNAELASRFVNEAQICARLQHPGIVPLHDLAYARDGRPFITMKRVQGQTLQELLTGRRVPAEHRDQFLHYFGQICQAVAYAHSQQVVHRDLKPANVMVGLFGEVQVMDWGLAKYLGQPSGESAGSDPLSSATAADLLAARQEFGLAATDAGSADGEDNPSEVNEQADYATQFGRVLGSPSYMSPEQAAGRRDLVGKRSDIFALGGILCKILTGLPPYWGANAIRTGHKAKLADLSDARNRLENSGCDPELIELTWKCLAVDPQDRFADGAEVAEAFENYELSWANRLELARQQQAQAELQVVDQRRRHRRQMQILVGTGLALAVGALMVVVLVRHELSWAWKRRLAAQRLAEIETTLKDSVGLASRGDSLNDWIKMRVAADEFLHLSHEGLASPEELARIGPIMSNFDFEFTTRLLVDAVRRLEAGAAGIATESDRLFASRTSAPLRQAFRAQLWAPDIEDAGHAFNRLRHYTPATQQCLIDGLYCWLAVDWFVADAYHNWLIDILYQAETDDWRRAVLQAARSGDRDRLRQLAAEVDVSQQNPHALDLLARSLVDPDDHQIGHDVLELLDRSRRAHPTDFWLTHDLALAFHYGPDHDLTRAVQYYAAALGMHPSADLHYRLGLALDELGRTEEAAWEYQAALTQEPDFGVVRQRLNARAER